MDDRCYIWCRTCDVIHHVSQFDREPIYIFGHAGLEETPVNDWRSFMARHASHRLEPLKANGDDYFVGGAWGPMSVRYFEVSNGKETLLLRRRRSNIEEPVHYEIVKARLVQTGLSLEVQVDAIRKEMTLHFRWAPATPMEDEKIDRFVSIFREVVSEIDPSCMRAKQFSDTDTNVAYCELDSTVIEKLIARCRSYFRPDELDSLRRFIDTHRAVDDVMALIKRRVVSIEQRAQ